MRPTLSEQSTDYAITQDVAADARATREEFRALDAEIESLRAQLASAQKRVKVLEEALIRVRDYQKLPLTDMADSDADQLADLRSSMSTLAHIARAALETKERADE